MKKIRKIRILVLCIKPYKPIGSSLPPRLYACIFVLSVNFILTHSFSLMVAISQS